MHFGRPMSDSEDGTRGSGEESGTEFESKEISAGESETTRAETPPPVTNTRRKKNATSAQKRKKKWSCFRRSRTEGKKFRNYLFFTALVVTVFATAFFTGNVLEATGGGFNAPSTWVKIIDPIVGTFAIVSMVITWHAYYHPLRSPPSKPGKRSIAIYANDHFQPYMAVTFLFTATVALHILMAGLHFRQWGDKLLSSDFPATTVLTAINFDSPNAYANWRSINVMAITLYALTLMAFCAVVLREARPHLNHDWLLARRVVAASSVPVSNETQEE